MKRLFLSVLLLTEAACTSGSTGQGTGRDGGNVDGDGGATEADAGILPDASSACGECATLEACVNGACVAVDGLIINAREQGIGVVNMCTWQANGLAETILASAGGCDAISIGDQQGLAPPGTGNVTIETSTTTLAFSDTGPACLSAAGSSDIPNLFEPGETISVSIAGGSRFPAMALTAKAPPPATGLGNDATMTRGQPFNMTWTPAVSDEVTVAISAGTTQIRCVGVADNGAFTIPGALTALVAADTANGSLQHTGRTRMTAPGAALSVELRALSIEVGGTVSVVDP